MIYLWCFTHLWIGSESIVKSKTVPYVYMITTPGVCVFVCTGVPSFEVRTSGVACKQRVSCGWHRQSKRRGQRERENFSCARSLPLWVFFSSCHFDSGLC